MEGFTNDNSDSDSSESWTFIDQKANTPDGETQNSTVNSSDERNGSPGNAEVMEDEDADTDGIAVITDEEDDAVSSTSQTPTVSIHSLKIADYLKQVPIRKEKSNYPFKPSYDTNSVSTATEGHEELPDDYFVEDAKIRSYVHKRNNKISGLLNVVLLGTVITAAGIAVGHMWGINDDCSLESLNSVSQVISDMQKLKDENDMLKSQIKVLESAQRKSKMPRTSQQLINEINLRIKEDRETKMFTDKLEEIVRESPPESRRAFGLHDPNAEEITFRFRRETYEGSDGDHNSEQKNHSIPIQYETASANVDSLERADKSRSNKKLKKLAHARNKLNKKTKCSLNQLSLKTDYIGPKTYCEYYADLSESKQKGKRSLISKYNPSKTSGTYSKNLQISKGNTFSKDIKKDKRQKDQKKYLKYEGVNLTEFASRPTDSGEDWQDSMARARQRLRERRFTAQQDNSVWYFKRMNDREKSRQDTDDFSKKFPEKEFYTRQNYKNTDSENDWYYRMSLARQRFRDQGLNAHDDAVWYFKRMNDREKSRHETDDFIKKFSKKNNLNHEPIYKSKR